MADYDNINDLLQCLSEDMEVETDNRERAREAEHFVYKRDGQWQPDMILRMGKRVRMTFDKCGPKVDQIAGVIDQSDFDIKVRPAGGDSTVDTAKIFDGIVRNIETISNAQHHYSTAGRQCVVGGISGIMLAQEYAGPYSFEQDLLIKPVHNFLDRVFYDQGGSTQTMEDANHVFMLTDMCKKEYKKKYPEGSCVSVSKYQGMYVDTYYYKKDAVTVGQIWYKVEDEIELVQYTDQEKGYEVYEVNEDFEKIVDELEEQGKKEIGRRTRKITRVYTRQFDGKEFLNEPQLTVWDNLPIIPCFGNFAVSEGKVIYSGIIERMMDPQRQLNFIKSRETEDIANTPAGFMQATIKQVQAHRKEYENMNTDGRRVRPYTPDPEAPTPPAWVAPTAVNPQIIQASEDARTAIDEAAGIYGVGQGQIDGSPMSGVAIQTLQGKADNATYKFFKSVEIMVNQAAKLLVSAIPNVYDNKRTVRLIGQGGNESMEKINDEVFDDETGEIVTVNDLSKGTYDVTCDAGPSFKNKQQETVKALTELLAVNPGLMDVAGDILLKSLSAPDMDLVSERIRAQQLKTDLIPQSQLTKEEMQQKQAELQAMQAQGQEPSAEDKIAEAERNRVIAETANTMSIAKQREQEIQLKALELRLKEQRQQADILKEQEERDIKRQELVLKELQEVNRQQQGIQQEIRDEEKHDRDMVYKDVQTLKEVREAMGADAMLSSELMQATVNQGNQIIEDQRDV